MADEPVMIRRTNTVEEADIIVAWLDEQGIEATVYDHENPGVIAFGVTDTEGIEIFVADAEIAERAKELLEEHDRLHAEEAAVTSGETVQVQCEECGHLNSYSDELRGSVQECAECDAYVDIPEAGE
ncbi:MAG: DUF2007 domain-containing protein [Phycisphaerales bacterium]|nr:MAG: DUF2007 domain-containing protein [Phycisphaerales bacterium]